MRYVYPASIEQDDDGRYVATATDVPDGASAGEALREAPLVAAKLALRAAMREQDITNTELARRMGISEGAIRRLADPDHASRLDGVVAALATLGRGLIIEDRKQAA